MFLGAQPQNGSSLKLFIALQTVETKARFPPVPAKDPLKSFSEQVWGSPPLLPILTCKQRLVLAQGFILLTHMMSKMASQSALSNFKSC